MADTPPTWAGRQVTDLTTLTGIADGDWVPIYDVSTPSLKKISASQIVSAVKYSTIAAMKNATGHDENTVAFLSDGTGRSGWFQLRSGAPVEAAGDYQGVELTYAGDGGLHWHRISPNGDINILWFGATNDYVDSTNAGGLGDFGAAINAAVSYLYARDSSDLGGKIIVPAGSYRQISRISIVARHVEIEGQGEVRVYPTGDAFTSLTLDTNSNWDDDFAQEVVDAGLSGSVTDAKKYILTSTPLLVASTSTPAALDIKIRGIRFICGTYKPSNNDLSAIVIYNSASNSSARVLLEDVQVSYFEGWAWMIQDMELITVRDCWAFDNGRSVYYDNNFQVYIEGGRSHTRYGVITPTWPTIGNSTSKPGFGWGEYHNNNRNVACTNHEVLGYPSGQFRVYSGIGFTARNCNTENQNIPVDYSSTLKNGNHFQTTQCVEWTGGHLSKLANPFTVDNVDYFRVSADYHFDTSMEPWREYLSVEDEDYVVNTAGVVYQCNVTSGPQTVGTMPAHASGTVVDAGNGNITYTWIRNGYYFVTASRYSNIIIDMPFRETDPIMGNGTTETYDGLWFIDTDGTCTLKFHPEMLEQVGNSEIVFSGVVTPSDITLSTTYHHVGLIPAGYEIEDFTLRLNGPVWQSDAKYWDSGVTSVDTGDYVITVDGRLYLCTVVSGPQTVDTKPTHTSGKVADSGNANIEYTFLRTSSEFSLFVAPAYYREGSTTSDLDYTMDALVRCSLDNNLGTFKIDEIGSEAAGIFYSGYTGVPNGGFVITGAGRIYKATTTGGTETVVTEPTHTTIGGTVPDAGNPNITHYEYYGPFYGKFSDAANYNVNGVIYGRGSNVYGDSGISGIMPASTDRNGNIVGARFSEPRRLWWRWGNSGGINSGELHWKLKLRSADF